MLESVRSAIAEYRMLDGVRSVTVAVSGGADSVSLLYSMYLLKDEYGYSLSAAHLNHLLRGSESDGDEQYVKELCEKLGIPLVCEKADISAASKVHGESTELTARKIRYAFLERVSDGVIATAHTADDNIETVLYNISRGTGILGLCGIPPKRGRIIRPLIFVTREQVECFCRENGLSYRTDSTNLSDDYNRNKIRHGAVPVLKKVNNAAVKNAACMSERLRTDAEFLSLAADKAYNDCRKGDGLDIKLLRALHPAILARCISRLCKENTGVAPENTHIDAVAALVFSDKGSRINTVNGCRAVTGKGILTIQKPSEAAGPFLETVPDLFPCIVCGVNISLETAKNIEKSEKINKLLFNSTIDYDKICGRLVIRNRYPGDKIKLCGRGVTKTLKKLFNESGIDAAMRDSIKVAADDMGVVWVCGFGTDERVSVTEKTGKYLLLDSKG